METVEFLPCQMQWSRRLCRRRNLVRRQPAQSRASSRNALSARRY